MSASLKAIEATVSSEGIVTLSEPVFGPARAILTLIVEDPQPNAETRAAMLESTEGLPTFSNVDDLMDHLKS
jgi:hypothetical protein